MIIFDATYILFLTKNTFLSNFNADLMIINNIFLKYHLFFSKNYHFFKCNGNRK